MTTVRMYYQFHAGNEDWGLFFKKRINGAEMVESLDPRCKYHQ